METTGIKPGPIIREIETIVLYRYTHACRRERLAATEEYLYTGAATLYERWPTGTLSSHSVVASANR